MILLQHVEQNLMMKMNMHHETVHERSYMQSCSQRLQGAFDPASTLCSNASLQQDVKLRAAAGFVNVNVTPASSAPRRLGLL